MAISEIITLKSVWDFFKPILVGSVKDRLKPRERTEIARARAFELYKSLKETRDAVSGYISDLEGFYRSTKDLNEAQARFREDREQDRDHAWFRYSPHLNNYRKRFAALNNSCVLVKTSLADLHRALKAVDPQLEIHQPEIVRQIEVYTQTEAREIEFWLSGVGNSTEEFHAIQRADSEELEGLLDAARANRDRVAAAVEDLRSFLAAQFSFKESF